MEVFPQWTPKETPQNQQERDFGGKYMDVYMDGDHDCTAHGQYVQGHSPFASSLELGLVQQLDENMR